MKKLIALLLCMILAMCALTACQNSEVNEGGDENKEETEMTDIDLITNGRTDYKIVYPANATEFEMFAVNELVYFFNQATGISLVKISDEGADTSTSNKYLSVGQTSVFEASGITATRDELGPNGFKIERKDNTVFLVGNKDTGTMFSVYEFLRLNFHYECYHKDEIKIDQNVSELKLADFHVLKRPDIDLACANYGELIFDPTFAYRRGMLIDEDMFINVGGNFWHNSFNYLPPHTYAAQHRDWYYYGNGESAEPTQLDYTNDEMRLALTEVLKQYLLDNPTLENITITHQDNRQWCNSAKNLELREKYGTDAASMIIFCNKVAKDIREWLNETDPGREINIIMFAYFATEQAPTRYNEETGSYEPIDSEVVLDEDVCVFYAPINADYNSSAYSQANVNMYNTLQQWKALTDRIFLWTYSTNFDYYMGMFNSFDSMQSIYQMARDAGVYYIFDQGQFNSSVSTGFSRLKMYLNSSLAWDVDADMDMLIQDFFDNYFKGASVPMKKLFDSMRLHYAYLRDDTNMDRSIYANIINENYFPKGVLDGWMDIIDEAYDSIADLQDTDGTLYRALEDRIKLESLSIRYLLIEIHGSTYTSNQLYRMKSEFKLDATKLGMDRYKERNGALNFLWSEWGVL